MNASLYVAKADGDREMMDDVTMEMARKIFAKINWDSEMAAARAAIDAGAETFMPEFGISQDEDRTLVISPVDSDTVSFYLQSPDKVFGAEHYPKSGVNQLIGLYFEGFDDDIAALIAKPAPAQTVSIRELSDAEFHAAIVRPMHRIDAKENPRQVHLRDYLSTCILTHSLPVTLNTIGLSDIYLAADKKHQHILFDYGDPDKSLAIIALLDPNNGDSILGHHFVSIADDCYSS